MTKEEAYFKMIEGHRITHTSFSFDEYLHMNIIVSDDPKRFYDIYDDCGYNWGNKRAESCQSCSGNSWETGWSIYEEKP